MIYGIGTDIVQIARIRAALDRHGEAFAARILADAEWGQWQASRDPARFLAKRFAAKEAFGKALGIGLSPPATLRALAVQHDERGRPEFAYDDTLSTYMQSNALMALLSLTDEKDYVVAFALIEYPGT
ncbi:MAG: holo-ACP synthase [Betaproteobacteria bacterium]|nr:holo-ACP synthase [Betaproteobacteria bacterium]